jgi:hypothetical protein
MLISVVLIGSIPPLIYDRQAFATLQKENERLGRCTESRGGGEGCKAN